MPTKKLKVCIAVRYFMNVGGMEKFSLSLTSFLRNRGHDVRAIAIKGRPMDGVSLTLVKSVFPLPRAMRDWFTGLLLAKAINKDNSDVVMGEQKMWNCDVIRPAGGVEDEYWKAHIRFKTVIPLPSWTRRLAIKRIFDLLAEQRGYRDPRLSYVIVNSRLVRDHLLLHYTHLKNKIHVFYEGIASDLRWPTAPSLRNHILQGYGLSGDALTGIFIGHDFRRKGLAEALRAIALARQKNPNLKIQLLILGRDNSAYCKRLARRLGVDSCIAFAGPISPPDACFMAADFLLLPTFYDPFANVTLEALAAGLPVITARQNGGAEILTQGVDGWVLNDPRDIEGFSECLLKIANPERLASMKNAALMLASKHSLETTLSKLEDILLQTAEEKSRVKRDTLNKK